MSNKTYYETVPVVAVCKFDGRSKEYAYLSEARFELDEIGNNLNYSYEVFDGKAIVAPFGQDTEVTIVEVIAVPFGSSVSSREADLLERAKNRLKEIVSGTIIDRWGNKVGFLPKTKSGTVKKAVKPKKIKETNIKGDDVVMKKNKIFAGVGTKISGVFGISMLDQKQAVLLGDTWFTLSEGETLSDVTEFVMELDFFPGIVMPATKGQLEVGDVLYLNDGELGLVTKTKPEVTYITRDGESKTAPSIKQAFMPEAYFLKLFNFMGDMGGMFGGNPDPSNPMGSMMSNPFMMMSLMDKEGSGGGMGDMGMMMAMMSMSSSGGMFGQKEVQTPKKEIGGTGIGLVDLETVEQMIVKAVSNINLTQPEGEMPNQIGFPK